MQAWRLNEISFRHKYSENVQVELEVGDEAGLTLSCPCMRTFLCRSA